VQFAVTLTTATTRAEKENKDTSGAATENRRDISYPKVRVVGGSRWNAVYSTQIHHFQGLIGAPCGDTVILISG
jgi:hypothetical protein